METEEHLRARSLTIVDRDGNPKIFLDGGQNPGTAHISLKSDNGAWLQIHEQPGGFITISLNGPTVGAGEVVLGPMGLSIRDGEGKLGVMIGKFSDPSTCEITVYRGGEQKARFPESWHS